nr:DUF397 domain-containing protein [Actinomadura sp. KC345]
MAATPGGVVIRDSKDHDGCKVFVHRGDFRRFVEVIRDL